MGSFKGVYKGYYKGLGFRGLSNSEPVNPLTYIRIVL